MDKKVCFLDFERENLVKLVGKYRDIVENKKTSSTMIDQKKRIWERITTEYNQNPNVKKRLTKQLKKFANTTQIDDLDDIGDVIHQYSADDPASTHHTKTSNCSVACNDDNLEELLMPVISLRTKKIEEATQQQKEIHFLTTQRERLQIKALEDRISQQTELHTIKTEQEREFHELRMSQEKDLYVQKVRWEQELHQLRLLDYNKVQSSAYSVMYKQ